MFINRPLQKNRAFVMIASILIILFTLIGWAKMALFTFIFLFVWNTVAFLRLAAAEDKYNNSQRFR